MEEKKIKLCGLFGSYRYVMENVDFLCLILNWTIPGFVLGCGVPVILFSFKIPADREDVRIIWVVFFSTQNRIICSLHRLGNGGWI